MSKSTRLYLGGQRNNKRQDVRAEGTKGGKDITKQSVFGILCREDHVWAEIVPEIKAETLMLIIECKVEFGSCVCLDMWKTYTEVASKGVIRREKLHLFLAEYCVEVQS
ncbi:hypothetical protein HGB07_09425 [Candidatus Roizmanbacteria bacterium]|nr:hypothetical protein [Candidatus Roizmanbacteria bacterium]